MHDGRFALRIFALIAILGSAAEAQVECLYVLNQLTASISIVEPTSRVVADTLPVGECMPPQCQLTSLVLSDDATRAYVTQLSPGMVYVVDVAGKTLIENVEVGQGASAAALTPDGNRLYVANLGGDSVSVIDTASNAVVDTIPVGDGPRGVAITPNGERVLIANRDNTVSVIRAADGEVTDTLTVGDQPAGIAVTADGSRAYVTNGSGDSVSPIALSNLAVGSPITVGENPRAVVFAPNGATAFVANLGSSGDPDNVTVIDVAAGTVVAGPITVGDGPVALALTDAGDTLYVANLSDDTISIVDTASRAVESIPGNGAPFDLVLAACPEGVGVTPTPMASPTPTVGTCTGDCSGDGTVSINELIQGVNIALGSAQLSACPIFDRDGDQLVGINELITAVINASGTCPA